MPSVLHPVEFRTFDTKELMAAYVIYVADTDESTPLVRWTSQDSLDAYPGATSESDIDDLLKTTYEQAEELMDEDEKTKATSPPRRITDEFGLLVVRHESLICFN